MNSFVSLSAVFLVESPTPLADYFDIEEAADSTRLRLLALEDCRDNCSTLSAKLLLLLTGFPRLRSV